MAIMILEMTSQDSFDSLCLQGQLQPPGVPCAPEGHTQLLLV